MGWKLWHGVGEGAVYREAGKSCLLVGKVRKEGAEVCDSMLLGC